MTKRKLDETDEQSQSSLPKTETSSTSDASFTDLGLDHRLVQAIAKQNFSKPTLVQRTAIPLALDGKDVIARAKTGSGKTAAYSLPVIQSVLKRKQVRYERRLDIPMIQMHRFTDCK